MLGWANFVECDAGALSQVHLIMIRLVKTVVLLLYEYQRDQWNETTFL